VFADLAVLLLLSMALSVVARWCRQPAVIGEIVAGIALGPTVLGLISPDLPDRLFPAEVRPYLTVLAQLGLALFMFGVGYELDGSQLRRQGRAATVVSLASIVLPFGLGVAAALVLHPAHDVVAGQPVSALALALFLGAAMSITAFPVLARILTDRGLQRNRIGTLSLGCAAINDFVAWCLLAVVVAVVSAGDAGGLVRTVIGSVLFLAFVVAVLGPAVRRLVDGRWAARQARTTLVLLAVVAALVCAAVTARIGLHPVFGAFAFGVVLPRRRTEQVAPGLGATVEQLSAVLLPVFFIVAGLSVDLGHLGWSGLGALALVVPLAIIGKFVGAAGAARLVGFGPRQSAAVGLLMNTRGLTELIILTIGLELGVLDTELFSIMVVVALVTTVMAGPLLAWVYPPAVQLADELPAEAELVPAPAIPADLRHDRRDLRL
jgi:Kef-type K+ transport system membrane component KefB